MLSHETRQPAVRAGALHCEPETGIAVFSRPIEGFLDKSKRLAGGVERKFSISWRSGDTFPTGYPKAAAMLRNLTDALRAQLGHSRR
ncbi:hypothetical protein [Paraburkholderia sp. BL18I3N2]|uniref:hypothetical protein n=1 Tax=Paraburkholderia sp. BL18I3N2 TaxID=1938799 RepID=UPI0011B20F29|nr:hypothetical protein [Paraburkholderia sp. BL18I3N2]